MSFQEPREEVMPCWNWNGFGGCGYAVCIFPHICGGCGSYAHGFRSCPGPGSTWVKGQTTILPIQRKPTSTTTRSDSKKMESCVKERDARRETTGRRSNRKHTRDVKRGRDKKRRLKHEPDHRSRKRRKKTQPSNFSNHQGEDFPE